MSTTLKDLAEAAGMSIRSVRRVLAGEPGISEESRKKVAAIVRRIGYVPNIAARNLRMQRSSFVGLISSTNTADVYLRREHALIKRFEEAGLHPLIAALPQSPEELRQLVQRWSGIVNEVVWETSPPPEIIAILPELPMRFVLVDAEVNGENFCSIGIDRSAGIRDAVMSLLRAGRRRIVHCGKLANRRAGFEAAFAAVSGSDGPERLFLEPADLEFEDGYRAGEQLLDMKADAVFFDVDRMAFGFLRYAWEKRIAVPRQIAVIGFDDELYGRYSCPTLSTVAQPINSINAAVVKLLGEGFEPETGMWFPTSFVMRESSDCIG